MSDSREELQQRIAAYIDGELNPAEAARLEVYLANSDPALAEQIVGMLADKVQVRALPKPPAPVDLSARIMEQIERGSLLRDVEHIATSHRPWWQSRAVAAAALLMVLGGFSYFVASTVLTSHLDSVWTAEGDVLRQDPPPAVAAATPSETAPATPTVTVAPGTDPTNLDTILAAADSFPKAGGAITAPTTPPTAVVGDTQIASAQPLTTPNVMETARGMSEAAGFGGGGRGGAGGRGGRGAGGGMAGARGTVPDAAGAAGGGMGMMAGGGMGTMGGGGMGGAATFGPLAAGRGAARGGRGAMTAPPEVRTMALANEGPLRAVATLASLSGDIPMVVTLRARDGQDYNRLSATLLRYAAENSRQRPTDTRLTREQAPATQVPMDDPRAGVRQQMEPLRVGSLQVQVQDNTLLQNSTIATGGLAPVTINGLGVVILDASANANQAFDLSANAINDNLLRMQQNQGMTGNVAQNANNMNQRNVYEMAQQRGNLFQQAAAQGGPYRVALRPEQLAEIVREFHVAVMARGDEVHIFQSAGENAPATADVRERNDLLRRAGLDDEALARNRAAIAARTIARADRQVERDQVPQANALAMEPTRAAPGAVARMPEGPTAPIECVIIMESSTER